MIKAWHCHAEHGIFRTKSVTYGRHEWPSHCEWVVYFYDGEV